MLTRGTGADNVDAFVRAQTSVTQPTFVPELSLYLAASLTEIWEAIEKRVGESTQPPFWAFAWPGSLAFARYLVDNPGVVAGRSVLDFAAGSGLAGIAAARAGAKSVLACDVDPLAAVAQRLNAELNGVAVQTLTRNLVDRDFPPVDVVLAGDVCYERDMARSSTRWLRDMASQGAEVLLADPGRMYVPRDGLAPLVQYDVPTTLDLERDEHMHTTIWRISAD
jgi:predicted nicotinamide N-methyase